MRKGVKIQREITPRGTMSDKVTCFDGAVNYCFFCIPALDESERGGRSHRPILCVRETEIPFQNPNLLSETYGFGSTGEILFGELDRRPRARYRLNSGGFWLIVWDLRWRLGACEPMRLLLSFRQGVLVPRVLIDQANDRAFYRFNAAFVCFSLTKMWISAFRSLFRLGVQLFAHGIGEESQGRNFCWVAKSKEKREKMQPKARIYADPSSDLDHFDLLPDSIVLLIFNKLADVRSLGRCSAVSKRFNSLVFTVHDVYIKIDRVVTVDGDSDDPLSSSSPRQRPLFANLIKLMLSSLLKPFLNLRSIKGSNKPVFPQLSHHSPAQVLKDFTHVHNLRIELPSGDVGTEEGVVLKWRAEFGSTLQKCVILGGTRVDQKPVSSELEASVEDNGSIPESFYTNGGLKLRVVWTISSLIAASTRHYLLRPIIRNHPTLKSLVLTDTDGQGTLCMGEEQLKEFREKPLAPLGSSNRTQVPASNMKLKYAPILELPGGMALQGATLVCIKPSSDGGSAANTRTETDAFISGAFDGPFKTAVKTLMKRRTYLLEMNGF
ncbi:hypothetical protein ZIOFF_041302 [Zingiber officinale]|uniref:F-box domain-containing protein n=1 Tax=Zingiber officinale TaxID=94328 RepID=A0A8J5GIJ5_ZINOF|nr:hypothetical protein ZIOFF_041302 [Zingiber officinale]